MVLSAVWPRQPGPARQRQHQWPEYRLFDHFSQYWIHQLFRL